MVAVAITAEQYASSQAARTELTDMLLSGTSGGGSVPAPFNGLAGVPAAALDMYQVIHLALQRVFVPAAALANQAGPLPAVSGNFTTKGGSLLIFMSGSGARASAGIMGMDLKIDAGATVGTAKIYTDDLNVHRAFSAQAILVTGIAAGAHTLTLTAIASTVTDANDFFSATVFEFPG